MKRLLNTLYVTSPNRYLALEGENVVVLEEQQEIGRVPLHNLDSIITFGYTGASPALMGTCAQRNIDLTFMSGHGRFLARVTGEVKGNVILRKQQYRVSESKEERLKIAKNFVLGKLYNSRWVLERAVRDYPMRIDCERIKVQSRRIAEAMKTVTQCEDAAALLGVEGEAATLYFSVFNQLILQQQEDFVFQGRNRRPPLDYVNALLSFCYSLLAGMCASALEGVGLDSYVGFYHTDRPGRISLALDLMEELRSVMADRFVLTLINRKMVTKNDFIKKENGAVILTDTGRKTVLSAWQAKKQDSIRHPFLEEKLEWGMVPHAQALLLARYLRGDLEEYLPFFWK